MTAQENDELEDDFTVADFWSYLSPQGKRRLAIFCALLIASWFIAFGLGWWVS